MIFSLSKQENTRQTLSHPIPPVPSHCLPFFNEDLLQDPADIEVKTFTGHVLDDTPYGMK